MNVWQYFFRTLILGVVLLGLSDLSTDGPRLTKLALTAALVVSAIQTAISGLRRLRL